VAWGLPLQGRVAIVPSATCARACHRAVQQQCEQEQGAHHIFSRPPGRSGGLAARAAAAAAAAALGRPPAAASMVLLCSSCLCLLLLLRVVTVAAAEHSYTYISGALPAGNDLIPAELMRLGQAEAKCSDLANCTGITFKSASKAPINAVKVYFKDKFTVVNADPRYQTYLRDYVPPPPPPTPGAGKLFLPKLFADNMVLQRAPALAHVWGWAAPGERVLVSLSGSADGVPLAHVSATAAHNGSWAADLPAQPPATGLSLEVSAESGSFHAQNVAVGDVYLCGGQSNMAFAITQAFNKSNIIADSDNHPGLRLFTVAHSSSPAVDVNVSTPYIWGVSSNATINGPSFGWFSAVCYLYGRNLYTALGGRVPIGLVASNVGGTFIQLWQSGDSLRACPADKLTSSKSSSPEFSPETSQWGSADVMTGANCGGRLWPPGLCGGGLWNGMVVPLLSFAMRGAIWCKQFGVPLPPLMPCYMHATHYSLTSLMPHVQIKGRQMMAILWRTHASNDPLSRTGSPSLLM
jgi:hypothetical protein